MVGVEKPTLCILGAGNCNDVDLARLATLFEDVHLVDLDESAMRRGVSRQLDGSVPPVRQSVHVHPPCDLSGILPMLGNADPDEVAQAAASADFAVDGQPFDVVASLCVMTQLIDAVVTAYGRDHRWLDTAVLAVRNRHLGLIGELTRTGGSGVLVTDFVSSDTAPDILLPGIDGVSVMRSLLMDRNFTTGTNPAAIEEVCRTEAAVRLEVQRFETPWVWNLGNRAYLTYALVFERTRFGPDTPSIP